MKPIAYGLALAMCAAACDDNAGTTKERFRVSYAVTFQGLATLGTEPLAGAPITITGINQWQRTPLGLLSSGAHGVVDAGTDDEVDISVTTATGRFTVSPGDRRRGHFELTAGDLRRYVLDVEFEEVRSGLAITPVTTWTATLADALHEARPGLTLPEAVTQARALLHGHLGGPQDKAPVSLTTGDVRTLSEPAGQAGLVLDSLGVLVAQLSVDAGLRPDSHVTVARLTQTLNQDIADGVFDGMQGDQALTMGEVALTPYTLRTELAQAMLAFVEGPTNRSPFGAADIRTLAEAISTRESAIFPPDGPPPAELDELPPTVTVSPERGAVLQGEAAITVEARDESDIIELYVRGAPPELLMGELRSPAAHRRHLVADGVFRTELIKDGPVEFEIVATDARGHTWIEAVDYQLDNNPPELVLDGLEDGDTVAGVVQLAATARDEISEVARLELTLPDGQAVAGEAQPDGHQKLSLEWDSTTVTDGEYTIRLVSSDVLGHAVELVYNLTVDNVEPGRVSGTVLLDSEVIGAEVAVHALTDDGLGARIDLCAREDLEPGCVTDEDGTFIAPIRDDYSGPWAVVATSGEPAARYLGVFGEEHTLPLGWTLLSAGLDYRPGDVVDQVVLSLPSTLALDWALVREGDIVDRLVESITTWGELLCDGCDVSRVRPLNWAEPGPVTPTDAGAQLGLFQVGLMTRLQQLQALGHQVDAAAWLSTLRADVRTGTVNGKGPDGPLAVDGEALSHCTMRNQAANAARVFVMSDANQRAPAVGLRQMLPWMQTLAAGVAPLWDLSVEDQHPDRQCPLDEADPIIDWIAPAPPVVVGRTGPQQQAAAPFTLPFELSITDDFGIASVTVSAIPDLPIDITNDDPATFRAIADFNGLEADGFEVEVVVLDEAGNRATETIGVAIDRSPPEVDLLATRTIIGFGGIPLWDFDGPLESSPADPIVGDELVIGLMFEEPTETRLPPGAATIDAEWNGWLRWRMVGLQVPGGAHTHTLEFADAYGNTTRETVHTLRVDETPTIQVVGGHYYDERDVAGAPRDCRDEVDGRICHDMALDWSAAPRIAGGQADWALGDIAIRRMDFSERAHMPAVELRMTDPLEEYVAQYRVTTARVADGEDLVDANWVARRGWRDLSAGAANAEFVISPSTVPDLGDHDADEYIRVEFKNENRIGDQATTAIVFRALPVAPPIYVGFEDGRSPFEPFSFGQNDALAPMTRLCGQALDAGRMLLHNPWDVPVEFSVRGRRSQRPQVELRQYTREAWRAQGDRTWLEPGCPVGEVRRRRDDDRGEDACFARVDQLDGTLTWPRRVSPTEVVDGRLRVRLLGTENAPVPSQDRNRAGAYVLAAGETVSVDVITEQCSLSFVPDGPRGTPSIESVQPTANPILRSLEQHWNLEGGHFETYLRVKRVVRLEAELRGLRANVYGVSPSSSRRVYDAGIGANWDVENPPLSWPTGYEGRE